MRHAGEPTEDLDQVWNSHFLQVQFRLWALEQVVNENRVEEELELKDILTRLYNIDTSSQNLKERKSSSEVTEDVQESLQTLKEPFNNLRKNVKHIMEINFNKKSEPNPGSHLYNSTREKRDQPRPSIG